MTIVIAMAGCLLQLADAQQPSSFQAVHCCTGQSLRVFPLEEVPHTVSLPDIGNQVVFGADGQSLYAVQPQGDSPVTTQSYSLIKVELPTRRVRPLLGSIPFVHIDSFAVSPREDRIILSGWSREGRFKKCGLYEVVLPAGGIREVLDSSDDCRDGAPWKKLSLSPDGTQAVAQGRGLVLINLVQRSSQTLAPRYSLGSRSSLATWSPDGRWIALIEANDRGRLLLLESKTLALHRTFGGGSHQMPPVWSPDSRYVLRGKLQLRCGISFDVDPPFTLERIDIATGKATTLRSSQCAMDGRGVTGWLGHRVVR